MRKENQSLWHVRHLWTSLCGDGTWMPCETMVGPNDVELFSDDHVARHLLSLSKAGDPDARSPRTLNGEPRDEHVENGEGIAAQETVVAPMDADVSMADDEPADKDVESSKQDKSDSNQTAGKDSAEAHQNNNPVDVPAENGDLATGLDEQSTTEGDWVSMQTRAKEAAVDRAGQEPAHDGQSTNGAPTGLEHDLAMSVTSEALSRAFIHPMFLPPAGARPDRDLGLPENEAEDIRRLLALYVQKQEEVCRGATKLHQGLMRAERLRKDVLHWSKAEAHSGPNRDMSDGEDWYDKEEWGLVDDLKKGQDEEEEDTTTTGKKTRNRRQ